MPMIPRVLLGRDPRNHDHVTEAMRIMEEVGGGRLLHSSLAEMKAYGITPPKQFKIVKSPPRKNGLFVGPAFLLERGKVLDDNVIVKCTDCGMAIQFRPVMGHASGTHVCIFCAADRAIKEYWTKIDAKAKVRRRSGGT